MFVLQTGSDNELNGKAIIGYIQKAGHISCQDCYPLENSSSSQSTIYCEI